VHQVRIVERKLDRDRAAERVANHVRLPDAQLLQQRLAVGDLIVDFCLPFGVAAAREAPPVVVDDPVVVSQGGLIQKGRVLIGEQSTVDQHDGLALAANLILQLDAPYFRAFPITH